MKVLGEDSVADGTEPLPLFLTSRSSPFSVPAYARAALAFCALVVALIQTSRILRPSRKIKGRMTTFVHRTLGAVESAPGAYALLLGALAGALAHAMGDRSGSRWRATSAIGQTLAALCVVVIAWPANSNAKCAFVLCCIRAVCLFVTSMPGTENDAKPMVSAMHVFMAGMTFETSCWEELSHTAHHSQSQTPIVVSSLAGAAAALCTFATARHDQPPFKRGGAWVLCRHPRHVVEAAWVLCVTGPLLSRAPVWSVLWVLWSTSALLWGPSGVGMTERVRNDAYALNMSYVSWRSTTSPLIPLPPSIYGQLPWRTKEALGDAACLGLGLGGDSR